MWVSSGLECRTDPMRTSFGSDDIDDDDDDGRDVVFVFVVDDGNDLLFLLSVRNRANDRRINEWFFSGRNCAM